MITFGDLFAGGGGVTTGAFSVPDLHVAWALNHDKTAIETHAINHPETRHYQADIRTQDVSKLDQVDVLWASTIYQIGCGNSTAQPIETIRAISFHIKDIKARFLNKDELGSIMGFPKGYFSHLSDKKAIKLIGNAVPTWLAAAVLRPNVEYLQTKILNEAI